jgi:hypothetical protein
MAKGTGQSRRENNDLVEASVQPFGPWPRLRRSCGRFNSDRQFRSAAPLPFFYALEGGLPILRSTAVVLVDSWVSGCDPHPFHEVSLWRKNSQAALEITTPPGFFISQNSENFSQINAAAQPLQPSGQLNHSINPQTISNGGNIDIQLRVGGHGNIGHQIPGPCWAEHGQIASRSLPSKSKAASSPDPPNACRLTSAYSRENRKTCGARLLDLIASCETA